MMPMSDAPSQRQCQRQLAFTAVETVLCRLDRGIVKALIREIADRLAVNHAFCVRTGDYSQSSGIAGASTLIKRIGMDMG